MISRAAGRFCCILLAVVSLNPGTVYGQPVPVHSGAGLPYFIENYMPDEYEAHHQNWAVVQDNRGVVYVGNTHGVLEYDGESWRLIPTANKSTVRSLAVGKNGRIYIGAVGEFGYLAPDTLGRMRYVSLLDKVPAEHRSFNDIWGTHVTSEGVYFQSHHYLFRWEHDTVRVWRISKEVYTSFSVRNKLYLWQAYTGILEMNGDSLVVLPGSEMFAETSIYAMIPYKDVGILIGTYSDGLFLYDGVSFTRFYTEVDGFLKEHKIYHGCRLQNGLYALGTLGGGAVIIDAGGRLQRTLDGRTGLQHERVYHLFPDAQGGLWIALYSGITRVAVPSPVTVYDRRHGLMGAVEDILYHSGTLYVATTSGLYHRKRISKRPSITYNKFDPVSRTAEDAYWSLLPIGNSLIAAANDGIYQITERGVIRLYDHRAFVLHQPARDANRIFAGLKDGLVSLHWTGSGWTIERIQGITDEIRSIAEDEDGDLWLGTRYQGVLRVDLSSGFSQEPVVKQFGSEQGLGMGTVMVTKLFGHPLFVMQDGAYRVRTAIEPQTGAKKTIFYPDSILTPILKENDRHLLIVQEGAAGNIWLAYQDGIALIERRNDGTYAHVPSEELLLPDTQVLGIYPEGSIVWLATKDGLLRYDRTLDIGASPPSALIRRVVVNGDSLVFGGSYADENDLASAGPQKASQPRLRYQDNNLRIAYAAPSYNNPSATRYQYMLDGFDGGWSNWTAETHKEYTNLPAGDYRFRVRAKTVNGSITEEGVFAFTVLPPWYQTWWAYGIYLFLFVGVVVAYGRYRAKVSAQKLEQERRVNERLTEANAELRRANELKDEFLANMSHELRTPLASILGFADLLDKEVGEPQREFVGLIKESGNRLYRTLNSLMDLAKFQSGVVTLDLEEIDVVQEVKMVHRIFEPKAREKGLSFEAVLPENAVIANLDSFCLERILNNLIDNAVKFTEEGSVTTYVNADEETISIRIADTGIGIKEESISTMFEAFRQESSGLSRSHQGVGLGLAITKRMVGLMNGTITVDSSKGEGTVFTVSFPRNGAV